MDFAWPGPPSAFRALAVRRDYASPGPFCGSLPHRLVGSSVWGERRIFYIFSFLTILALLSQRPYARRAFTLAVSFKLQSIFLRLLWSAFTRQILGRVVSDSG